MPKIYFKNGLWRVKNPKGVKVPAWKAEANLCHALKLNGAPV